MPHRSVRSVMQTQVMTLRPEMSAQDAGRLFAEHKLTGAPVIDDANRVLGVVSQSDLIRLDTAPPSTATAGAFFTNIADYADLGALPADESMVRIDTLMSHRVLSVASESPLTEAARLMREHRVHRLLVIDGDRLCGIVTAFDLLIAIEEAAAPK